MLKKPLECMSCLFFLQYVMSDNCQMEFRFAHIALKKPIILAVAGTGYKWEATEVRIRLQMGGNRGKD